MLFFINAYVKDILYFINVVMVKLLSNLSTREKGKVITINIPWTNN